MSALRKSTTDGRSYLIRFQREVNDFLTPSAAATGAVTPSLWHTLPPDLGMSRHELENGGSSKIGNEQSCDWQRLSSQVEIARWCHAIQDSKTHQDNDLDAFSARGTRALLYSVQCPSRYPFGLLKGNVCTWDAVVLLRKRYRDREVFLGCHLG